MKKILILTFYVLTFSSLFSQSSYTDYFEGKRTYCPKPTDEKSLEIFDLGIELIHKNLYLGSPPNLLDLVIFRKEIKHRNKNSARV